MPTFHQLSVQGVIGINRIHIILEDLGYNYKLFFVFLYFIGFSIPIHIQGKNQANFKRQILILKIKKELVVSDNACSRLNNNYSLMKFLSKHDWTPYNCFTYGLIKKSNRHEFHWWVLLFSSFDHCTVSTRTKFKNKTAYLKRLEIRKDKQTK